MTTLREIPYKRCWNCGRELARTALGDYGSLCVCGIDHWLHPHKVPVVEDEVTGLAVAHVWYL
jgi:hypothetical protein